MSHKQAFDVFGGILALVALAYFALIAARPGALARVLLARGYEAKGWNEPRLTARMRLLGVAGALLSLAGILLAIVKFVG